MRTVFYAYASTVCDSDARAFDADAERAADACALYAGAVELADGTAYSGAHGRAEHLRRLRRRGRVHEVPESEGHEPLLRRRQLEGEV